MYVDFHTHRPTAEGVVTPRCFGIHPWDIDSEQSSDYDAFRRRHLERFNAAEMIGECGLDRLYPTDYGRQKELFAWQAMLADELGKPMVVHCVRAMDDVVALRKKLRSTPWFIHGFIGGIEQAQQLHHAGIGISLGAAILDKRHHKLRNCLAQTSLPFFLETDDSSCTIETIYDEAAALRHEEKEMLAETIKQRYMTLFQKNI
ncbi:MAG: TatD family hydrolase [Bacteroidales bacterium]|nr:TatD family hydrolase [Bacteroidales bacterium]